MALKKITNAEIQAKHVQAAPDTLTGTAAQNKSIFDELPEFIAETYNDTVDKLTSDTSGSSGADNVGASEIAPGGATTVQGILNELGERMEEAEETLEDVDAKKHTHNNLELLETYEQTEEDLSDAVAKKHSHSNKDALNSVPEGGVETELSNSDDYLPTSGAVQRGMIAAGLGDMMKAAYDTGLTGNKVDTAIEAEHADDSDKLGGSAAADYAKLASPAFTGTPTAPTAADGTDTTQLATTAFVKRAVGNAVDPLVTPINDIQSTVHDIYDIVSAEGVYGFIEHCATLAPSQRIEYIGKNKDYTPLTVTMGGGYSLGSWGGFSVLANNKPWMVHADGTPDYELLASDYSKKVTFSAVCS